MTTVSQADLASFFPDYAAQRHKADHSFTSCELLLGDKEDSLTLFSPRPCPCPNTLLPAMLLLCINAGAKGKLGAFTDRDPSSCFSYQERLLKWSHCSHRSLGLNSQRRAFHERGAGYQLTQAGFRGKPSKSLRACDQGSPTPACHSLQPQGLDQTYLVRQVNLYLNQQNQDRTGHSLSLLGALPPCPVLLKSRLT